MKRNFAYTFVSTASRLLVSFLLFLLLARLWGPTQFGLFAFAFSVSALVVLIVDFGFHVYLLREVAATPEQAPSLIREAFRAKTFLAGVSVVVALILVSVLGPNTLPPALAIPLYCAALLASFADFFIAPLRAFGLFDQETIVVTLANFIQFALAGTAAWHGGDVVIVAWAIFAARGIYLILAYRRLQAACPQLKLRAATDRNPIATLQRIWTYGAEGMLGTAWNQLDIVLVRALCGKEAVGIYSAGQKIVGGIYALAPVVGNVMIPRLSILASRQDFSFWRTAKLTVLSMSAIGFCFALPLIVASAQIVHLLFGAAFQGMGELLPIFAAILIIKYANGGIAVAIVSAALNNARILAPIFGMATVGLLLFALGSSRMALNDFMFAYIAGLLVTGLAHTIWLLKLRASQLSGSKR